MEKFQSIKSKLFRSKNSLLIIIIVAIVMGYASFFVISAAINNSDSDLLITEIDKEVAVNNNCKVTINKWEYSEKLGQMEVILSFDNSSIDTKSDYIYQVCSRQSGDRVDYLEFDKPFETSYFSVLVIKNVPAKFKEIALYVGFGNEEKSDNKANSYAVLYTNKDEVEKVDEFEEQSAGTIFVSIMNTRLVKLEDKTKELEKENNDYLEQQQAILDKVAEIKANESYMTSTDKGNAEQTIKQYQGNYNSINEKIEKNKKEIENIEDQIEEITDKIEEISNGNIKEGR